MATWHAKKGDDAALGVALIAWLAVFLSSVFFFLVVAALWTLTRYGLFEKKPPLTLTQYVIAAACLVGSAGFSSLFARAVYRALRKRWSDL